MDTILERPPVETHTARIEERQGERPVFSAYEVGRATIVRETLQLQTGYSFALPREDNSPAEVFEIYQTFPELDYLPVRDDSGWITGYFTRKTFLASLSQSQFSRDLLFRKEARIHNLINRNIVCLNAHTSLSEASEILMRRPDRMRFDPFVVTLDRHFFGISTVDQVIRGINYFISREMEAVKDAQLRILDAESSPSDLDSELNFHALIQPFQGPGGDFAKIYNINDRFSVVALFDVCGKGVKAAAMVSVMGTLLHTMWKELTRNTSFTLRVLENELFRFNNELVKLTSTEMYATGVFCLIDRQSYILSILDYGHGMIWLRRNNRVHALANPGNDLAMSFLGITENLRLSPFSFRVKPGDILLSCSDGIVEQVNHDREMYGHERISESFQIANGQNLSEIASQILEDWTEFRSGSRTRDDVSLMLLEVP